MEDPGFLSIVPPLLALALAIATRSVILSLGLGVLLGMILHCDFNPLRGLLAFFEQGIFVQLSQGSNAQVIILIMVIGGFVRLLESSGGMMAFARQVTRWVATKQRAQLAVWGTGLAIFFTDSGNALILGPMFRPIFDRLGICREKLAFLIDSTASPVCVLVPFISWGVYIMGLLEVSFADLGLPHTPLEGFLHALPFQLYPVLALSTVPLLVLSGREWGPMARAQRRLRREEREEEQTATAATGGGSRTVLIPLATVLLMLGGCFALFLAQRGRLGGAEVRLVLLLAYLSGAVVCALLLKRAGLQAPAQAFQRFLQGMGGMVYIALILLLAWSLGDVCELLGTGSYVAGIFDRALHPGLLPALVFALGAVFSLATGSSWGTFALLLPIAIPVAQQAGAPLWITIGAALSGGVFGDHCSPVSDTTILSSMSSGCAHADHVNTQIPYAAVTGGVALLGFLAAGLLGWTWILLPALVLQLSLVALLARRFGSA